MNDAEITKRCADAMGLTLTESGFALIGFMDAHPYDPLKNDSQTMELIRRFPIQTIGAMWDAVMNSRLGDNLDLRRVACECVAKIEAAK